MAEKPRNFAKFPKKVLLFAVFQHFWPRQHVVPQFAPPPFPLRKHEKKATFAASGYTKKQSFNGFLLFRTQSPNI
jgi:hypothetical protein